MRGSTINFGEITSRSGGHAMSSLPSSCGIFWEFGFEEEGRFLDTATDG